MITLIDQSDAEKLKFHCDQCNRTFVQATRAFLDLHRPVASQDALKLGIPPCQPLPAEPAPLPAPRARKPKAAPVAEPAPAPKKRGRPRKVEAL